MKEIIDYLMIPKTCTAEAQNPALCVGYRQGVVAGRCFYHDTFRCECDRPSIIQPYFNIIREGYREGAT